MSVVSTQEPGELNEGVAILAESLTAWPRGESVTLPATAGVILVDPEEDVEQDEFVYYSTQAKEFEASIVRALRKLWEIQEEVVQITRIPDIEQDIFVRMKPLDSFKIKAKANYLGQATPRVVTDLVEQE